MNRTLDDILMDLDQQDRDERDLNALVPLASDEYRPVGWNWRGFHYGKGDENPLPKLPHQLKRKRHGK